MKLFRLLRALKDQTAKKWVFKFEINKKLSLVLNNLVKKDLK